MTLSLPIPDHLPALDTPADTWDHLTDDDARRVAAAMAASHAETARKAYAQAWRQWVRWSAGRGLMPFPAEAAAVCAYLTERADQGVSLATIDAACAAIGHQHRSHGLPDPIDQDAVRQVRRGLRRILGTAPRRPARPLSVADLRQIVTTIDRTAPRGIRDTALILVGFAGALRRSELAALTVDDIEAKPAGLLLHLRRSKTDPERRGQVVGIAHGQHALTDPITALDAWLAVRGAAAGPVFTSMRPGLTSLEPISGNAVSNIVKDRARAAWPGWVVVRAVDHDVAVEGHETVRGRLTLLPGAGVHREPLGHVRVDTGLQRTDARPRHVEGSLVGHAAVVPDGPRAGGVNALEVLGTGDGRRHSVTDPTEGQTAWADDVVLHPRRRVRVLGLGRLEVTRAPHQQRRLRDRPVGTLMRYRPEGFSRFLREVELLCLGRYECACVIGARLTCHVTYM